MCCAAPLGLRPPAFRGSNGAITEGGATLRVDR